MIDFGLTPPMGWYSGFNNNPTTEDFLLTTITYISQYLKDFGYEYIIIDDSWYAGAESNEQGFYIPTDSQFKSAKDGAGFKVLSDYIHRQNLKLGLHILPYIPDVAVLNNICLPDGKTFISEITKLAGNQYVIDFDKFGAINYYEYLFNLYASWGIDLIYIDLTVFKYNELSYISEALKNCDHTMLLYVSSPIINYTEMDYISQHANMWPISDTFLNGWSDILNAFKLCKLWHPIVGNNSWPIFPFIASELKNRFTFNEQMSLLTLCAILKSPIIFDGNFKELPNETQALLTNMDVLSLLKRSHAAYELSYSDEHITWTTQANDGSRYLAIFNITPKNFVITTNLNLPNTYKLYDLWTHENLQEVTGSFSLDVPPHGVRLIKLIAQYESFNFS